MRNLPYQAIAVSFLLMMFVGGVFVGGSISHVKQKARNEAYADIIVQLDLTSLEMISTQDSYDDSI